MTSRPILSLERSLAFPRICLASQDAAAETTAGEPSDLSAAARRLLDKTNGVMEHSKTPNDWPNEWQGIVELAALAKGQSPEECLSAAAEEHAERELETIFQKFGGGEVLPDDEILHEMGVSRWDPETKTYRDGRVGGKGNYSTRWFVSDLETGLAMTKSMQEDMGVTAGLTGPLRSKFERHDWNQGQCCLTMSGEGDLETVKKYHNWPTPDIARRGRNTGRGRVRNDGMYFLLLGSAVLTDRQSLLKVETVGWRQGGEERELVLHETLALVHLGGHFYIPESYNCGRKLGRRFTLQQSRDGGELSLVFRDVPHVSGTLVLATSMCYLLEPCTMHPVVAPLRHVAHSTVASHRFQLAPIEWISPSLTPPPLF